MPPDATKDRLLDAAEACFAEAGYAATSLRAITTKAKVNLAAVSYHFGGKEALYLAVFARRIDPVNRERLERLAALEAAHADRTLPLEGLLDAFLRPALQLAQTAEGQDFMRIVGRMSAEAAPLCRRIDRCFDAVKARYLAALQRALPGHSLAELFWRGHFMVGAMLHTMSDTWRLREMSNGLCDPGDVDGVLRRLVPFVAAGLRSQTLAASPATAGATP